MGALIDVDTVDVTVISCLYGETHERFAGEWANAVSDLRPFPYGIVVVACDRPRLVLGGRAVMPCDWKHQQAYYLQQALNMVDTEWVWIHDIDDVAYPDALKGIDQVAADVWQLGYKRSDGETYLPPQLNADEVLNAERNPFVAGSCVRTETLRKVGGVPDCALQDWALWRRLALAGASFASSDRIHFYYRRHDKTRGAAELTLDRREEHVREMLDLEGQVAFTC